MKERWLCYCDVGKAFDSTNYILQMCGLSASRAGGGQADMVVAFGRKARGSNPPIAEQLAHAVALC